ncbi:S-adenosyl-L-methionine-dependent methyltransferase [Tilletiaria anomala UBC 951]|uniref:S-adenosyl-L-methionine-dependent methyltransferase n=1 Tax=Tilletiaria anomala (strain ATCC 24038 / CBS 436.72 / UBC 951) TaxID=1037660 RepID=A0A066VTT5_TILAU|nr:S-adenosyl-L-methionine-dependent methyltransferase [Tilletiaria anomala UBC 951]KDN41970.1 S-adenosyl-L-methionine-dependent methyltransferase [Tilletiaria anomala UBC 951]
MIPTPDLAHISRSTYEHVYEPAEDTFILLDALEADASILRDGVAAGRCKRPRLCVEIGPGSGCVSAFLAKIVGETEAAYICLDINAQAAEITRQTGSANGVPLSPIISNLLSNVEARVHGKVDVLVFNPPYVPTSAEEEAQAQCSYTGENGSESKIEAAWAGGSMGTRLLEMLIEGSGSVRWPLEEMLAPGGSFYFVAIKQNAPEKLVERLRARGLTSDIVLSRRAGGEHLFIIRAVRHIDTVE